MKILVITPHVFEGGAEKAILNLVYQLNSLGCDARIATLSLDLSKLGQQFANLKFILPNKQLAPPKMNSATSIISSMSKELLSFVSLLKQPTGQFDIICACNFPSYWATYMAGVSQPVIWLSSEVLAPYSQTKDVYDRSPFFRIALRAASIVDKRIVKTGFSEIVTCSTLNSGLIKERYRKASLVLLTGVDYDFFDAAVPYAKARLGLGDGPLLVQVGALLQKKNQILSIRALKCIKRQLKSTKLLLVGEGPWKSILQGEAKKLGLEDDVIFFGNISEEKLQLVYHACDVNLFPVKDQTWGLVPFEALAAGVPSVVAKGAGAADVMGREKIGFIINPTAKELADAVLFILRNPELTATMVKRGKIYVATNLTWEKYAQDMLGVFERVLSWSRF